MLLLCCCVDDAELPELMFSLFIVILLTVEIGGTFVQIKRDYTQNEKKESTSAKGRTKKYQMNIVEEKKKTT